MGWSWERSAVRQRVDCGFGAAGQRLRKASVGSFRLSCLYTLDLILLSERTRTVPHISPTPPGLCVEMGSRFHWCQREKERAKTWVLWKVQSPDFLEISSFRNTPTPTTFLVSIIHFNSYKKTIIKVGMRGKEKVCLNANPFLSSETPLWSGFKIFTGDSLLYSCVVFKAGAVLQGDLGVSGISRLSFLIFSLCTEEGSISIVLHNATGQGFGHYSISGWGVHQILKHPKKTGGYYF